MMIITRKPAVAGQFYPGNKNELEEMVKGFLAKAKVIEEKGQLSVLIIPHAGYVYSGQTVAYGFKHLTFNIKHLTKVILLGVSHQSWFNDVAIDNSDFWETPLGKVKVNKDLEKKLVTGGVEFNRESHISEHSLEVEIPFIQTIVKDCFPSTSPRTVRCMASLRAGIVPLLIGETDDKTLERLAEKITENIDWGKRSNRGNKENTVLIISSDLSHYPDIKTAKIVDQRTIEAIKSGEVKIFERELEKLAKEFPDVETFACGSEAIKVGMMVAKKLDALKIKILAKTNSGEVTGDTSRVVGYVAMGFYK